MKNLNFATPLTGRRTTIAQNPKAASADGSSRPRSWNKWKLARHVAEIKDLLGLSDRSLSLLSALLSFHPETDWEEGALGQGSGLGFVVFPSNRQLALRAHGMAEKTMRRHLAALVTAGLVLRRDSPNRKRFARREETHGGELTACYGFDLSPLLAQAARLERQSHLERRRQVEFAALKERVSLLRQAVDEALVQASFASAAPQVESWRAAFKPLLIPLRRLRNLDDVRSLEQALGQLLQEIAGARNLQELAVKDGSRDRHQSESEPEYLFESEDAQDGERDAQTPRPSDGRGKRDRTAEGLSLGLVLEACPDVQLFNKPGTTISSWQDLGRVSEVLRSALGVSSDAWSKALDVMGLGASAATLAFILQRSEFSSDSQMSRPGDDLERVTRVFGKPCIRSPGGYLRKLTEEARIGKLKLVSALSMLVSRRQAQKLSATSG